MSKRKSNPQLTRSPRQPKAIPIPTKEELLTDGWMIRMQKVHLDYLEEWAARLPRLYGVPVTQTLTYELVQIINNLYIKEILA